MLDVPNTTPMAWDIFLAHASSDKEQAEQLYDLLSTSGYSVFLDTKCLPLGANWDVELPRAQRASQITVVLISTRTEEAYYEREEITAAIAESRSNTGHQVIPIYLEKSVTPPYGMRRKQGLSIPQDGGLENVAKALVEHLSRIPNNIPRVRPEHLTTPLSKITNSNSTAYCSGDETPSQSCLRFQALLDFSYLFICLDQLESGSWGTSVAFWMKEVGKRTPGFRLQREMATEGGIETTAFCAQALANFLPGQDVSNKSWATKCRAYFRTRQKQDGSFGYERLTVRDHQREIESTCRHTAQAILALVSLSDHSIDLLQSAFVFLSNGLFPRHVDDPSSVANAALEREKYPAMLVSALVYSLQLIEQKGPRLANDFVSMKVTQDIGRSRRILVESLAFLDRDRYPLFTPYGQFEEMSWYSFLSVLNLLSEQNLQCIKNRLNDGIGSLLDESDKYHGLPFCQNGEAVDFGLTALFLNVLSSSSVNDILAPGLTVRAETTRHQLFQWLLCKFDSYRTSPATFSYTSSGTLVQSVWQPKCPHIDCGPERLAELDKIVQNIKGFGLTGTRRVGHMVKLMQAWFGNVDVDHEAIASLYEDRVLNIEKAF